MTRIRIEDLAPVEDLTPQEMEELFGAGRFSFRPTFEALEAREMMDAGIGHAVMPRLAVPEAPQATHMRSMAPSSDLGMEAMVKTLAKSQLGASYGNDAATVQGKVNDILVNQIIQRAHQNRWWIMSDNTSGSVTQSGNKIEFTTTARESTLSSETKRFNIKITLEGSIHGATTTWKVTEAHFEGYKGGLGGDFDKVAKDYINGRNNIQTERFDATFLKNNSLRIAEQLTNAKPGSYTAVVFTGIQGGTRLIAYTDNNAHLPVTGDPAHHPGRGEVHLDWKYDYSQAGGPFLQLAEYKTGFYYKTSANGANQWYDTTDAGMKQNFLAQRWWTSAINPDAAKQQGAGALGNSLADWFKGKGCLNSELINATAIQAKVLPPTFTQDGMSVQVELTRSSGYKGDSDLRVDMKVTLTIHMKLDGVDPSGKATFTRVGDVDARPESTWTKISDGTKHTPRCTVDLMAFGTPRSGVEAAFNTFTHNVAG